MVKQFRGQVKISDVQEEFDNITKCINSMVDAYNASLSVQDIDYSIAAESLAPSGYCLTVGGLKQLIKAYNGSVIGCKAYKLSDNQVKVTNGLLFYNGKIYRINDRIVATNNKSILYYDTTYNRLTFGASGGTSTSWKNYTIPEFTSSSSFGNIFANYNSGSAYKARRNNISAWNNGWNLGNINAFASKMGAQGNWAKARVLTWNFPSGVRITGGAKLQVQLAVSRKQQAVLTSVGVSINNGTIISALVSWNGNIGTASWTFSNTTNISSIKLYVSNVGVYTSGWDMYMGSINLNNVQKSTIISTGEKIGELVKIADLNMSRSSLKYVNSMLNTQVSGLTKYRYTMNKKAYGRLTSIDKMETFNNSTQGNFYIADMKWFERKKHIKLFGINVEVEPDMGNSDINTNRMYSPLYIPKGLSIPYTYEGIDIHKARTATKKTS